MDLGERLGAYETKMEKDLKAQLTNKEALLQKQEVLLGAYREMMGKN